MSIEKYEVQVICSVCSSAKMVKVWRNVFDFYLRLLHTEQPEYAAELS